MVGLELTDLSDAVGTKGVHYHIHLLPSLYWEAQVLNVKMLAESPNTEVYTEW